MHAAVLKRRFLQRHPQAECIIIHSGIPICLVLMPGRRGAVECRFQNGVIALFDRIGMAPNWDENLGYHAIAIGARFTIFDTPGFFARGRGGFGGARSVSAAHPTVGVGGGGRSFASPHVSGGHGG